MRLHLERHIRKEYGGREDLSPRERAKLTRRLSRTLHSSGQSPGVSSRRSGLSERERLPDQVNHERLLERVSARRNTERTDHSRSASSPPRRDSGSDRSDMRSRQTADTSDRDRSDRSESHSGREGDEN